MTTALGDSIVRERAEFIAFWNAHLRDSGTKMLVVLLRDKISVYGPIVGAPSQGLRYLKRLGGELRRRGIPYSTGCPFCRSQQRPTSH